MNLTEKNRERFEALPYPEWKRLQLPKDLFNDISEKPITHIEGDLLEVEITPIQQAINNPLYASFFERDYAYKKTLGEKFISYVLSHADSGSLIHGKIQDMKPRTVRLSYTKDQGTAFVESNLIIAEPGAKLTVILDYQGDSLRHYGTTRVVAKQGSQVHVIKLQRLTGQSEFYDQNLGVCEEGAQISWYDLEIGSILKAVAYETDLIGRYAASDLNSIYYGEEKHQLDISYTMRHFGKHSESAILSKGALDKEAAKVFRGNLEFEKGASQSVGKEGEYVVILDPRVHSDSIPALMCSEDDVVGEHAASVGQVDQDKLFYLMSRGFSETEAKKLVVKGSFEEIITKIPFEDIQEIVSREMDRRI